MKQILTVIATAAFVALGGCATIMHGSTESVGLSSNPANATVWVDGQQEGQTPITLNLKRGESHKVTMKLAGYQPYSATFTKSVSGWVWGNLLFGGVIGLAVDAISGGLYKLTPQQVSAEMQKKGVAYHRTDNNVFVAVVLKPEAGWQQIGNLTPAS